MKIKQAGPACESSGVLFGHTESSVQLTVDGYSVTGDCQWCNDACSLMFGWIVGGTTSGSVKNAKFTGSTGNYTSCVTSKRGGGEN